MKKLTILCLTTLLYTSCARIYNSPDAVVKARTHKIISVLPPTVSIPPQKKITPEQLEKLRQEEAEQIHLNMISWLDKRKEQNKITVMTLDALTTQAKIERKLKELNYTKLTIEENCDCLEVDGLLNLNIKLTKPMSTGAAIATTLLFGFGNTNQALAYMELYDCKTKKVIWSFNHTLNGGIFNTSEQLVNELMRLASKKLPYTKI